jgi:hypothetical protein
MCKGDGTGLGFKSNWGLKILWKWLEPKVWEIQIIDLMTKLKF